MKLIKKLDFFLLVGILAISFFLGMALNDYKVVKPLKDKVNDLTYTVKAQDSAIRILDSITRLFVQDYVCTIYNATTAQCDNRPDILASCKRINVWKAGSYRYCAVSRNLLLDMDCTFSDDLYVLSGQDVKGNQIDESYTGVWHIEDIIPGDSAIDLLVDLGEPQFKGKVKFMVKRNKH